MTPPRCSVCGTEDATAFARSSKSASGYQGYCRRCTYAARKLPRSCSRRDAVLWLREQIRAHRATVAGVDIDLAVALDLVSCWLLREIGELMKAPPDG